MRVESNHYPYLPVTLALGGRRFQFEAILDTGFDGGLAVAESVVASRYAAEWKLAFVLADGSLVNVSAYLGTVQIGSLAPVTTIVIALGDEP